MGPYCNKKHTIEYQRCLFVLEHRGTAQKKNNNFAFNQVGCRVTEDRRTRDSMCFWWYILSTETAACSWEYYTELGI